MTMKRFFAAMALVAGCGGGAPATAVATGAVSGEDDLSEMLAPIARENRLPALAVRVMRGDTLVGQGVVGVRKDGDATPATEDDSWHLGSDTKAMTATLAAMLVNQGRIGWTTTLAQALPGVAMHDGYRDVTLEMLLAHRGGAPANLPRDVMLAMWQPGDPPAQRRAAVTAMLERGPETTPGAQFVYANAGYMMASLMLETVSGRSWEDLIRERLFNPLEMTSCGFGAPATAGRVDQPWGHRTQAGALQAVPPGPQSDNPPALGPAGTVHCSLADWSKFLRVHLAGARGEPTLLPTESFKKLQTPWPNGNYALGWGAVERPWAHGMALTHVGSNTLFCASVWIAPAKNLVFTIATNRGDTDVGAALDRVAVALVSRYAKDGS
jgi:D-alanyl-D-alanine carboxypeptidase